MDMPDDLDAAACAGMGQGDVVHARASGALTTRLVRNVVANWLGYLVFVASGFILPRLISERLGQGLLGIWDLAWAVVSYTQFLSFGVGGAASRYVARYRAREDWISLSAMASACLAFLVAASLLAGGLALILVWLTPRFLASSSADAASQAQWLVAILGFNTALLLPLALFDGVVTGCERFDLKNLVRCGCRLAALGIMAMLLLAGRGLVALACTTASAELATAVIYIAVARRLCPQLRMSASLVSWKRTKEAVIFGGKTMLQMVSRSALYQTNAIVVAYFLGPSALAVYARQRALTMFVTRLLNQYGNVFTPASSSLQASCATPELRRLLVDSTRYALYVALPLVAVLTIAGGSLVRLWMGQEYVSPVVLATLAIGHLVPASQRGAYRILVGLNRHGAAALAELIASIGGIALGVFLVGVLGWGMVGAALAVGVAATVGGGIAPALYACRSVRLPMRRYLAQVIPGPMSAVLPFVACMVLPMFVFGAHDTLALVCGLSTGTLALVAIYWRYVLPPQVRRRLAMRLRFSHKRALDGSSALRTAQAEPSVAGSSLRLGGGGRSHACKEGVIP